MASTESEKLLIIWTSGEIEVARKMVLMYSTNARLNNWWDEITLLVWGPSTRLLVNEPLLQEDVKQAQDAGVRVIACKACAEKFGIVPQVEALGIEVFYSGVFLTDWIKSGDRYISF